MKQFTDSTNNGAKTGRKLSKQFSSSYEKERFTLENEKKGIKGLYIAMAHFLRGIQNLVKCRWNFLRKLLTADSFMSR